MMKLRSLLFLLLLVSACGPDKKKAKTDPNEPEYKYEEALRNYDIGLNYINRNDVLQGIVHLEMAVRLDPNSYRYHHGLGLAYSLNGQLADAERELNRALTINPKDTVTANLLGTVLTEVGRFEEAMRFLKMAIEDKEYPQPEFPYFNLGLLMERWGRQTEAVAAYNRVVQINPAFYRAYLSLGQIYKQNERFKDALFYFKKAEPGYPEDVRILFEIGNALFRLKQFEESKRYLAQVSIMFPPPDIDNPTQEMLRFMGNQTERR